MLRIIRRRLSLVSISPTRPTRILISRSAATSAIETPYGQEYGAGPSRLPYQSPPTNPSPFPRKSRRDNLHVAQELRRTLLTSQSFGQYANPQTFSHHLRQSSLPLITEMTRLELHAVVHHLTRIGRSTLAIGIITQAIDTGHSSHPSIRRLFSRRSLRTLLLTEKSSHDVIVRRNPRSQLTKPGHVKLNLLLDLLRSLQSIRHHRPVALYSLLIQMSVYERRPDKAAEIFVGLVEEWVTEGRVAEGADAEGFYEGGGPPKFLREDIARRHKSWWSGVRTWKLPGEVLSPHDRLDLWHPTKLSLGGKFKHFPFPLATSPPTMVPPPSSALLDTILSSLRLDPTVAAPKDFEASMRACAILANTVLSRTLPLTSLGPLLRVLESTPSSPPIYPSTLEGIPKADAWAYEAFTQIHLALQSFFFSPPISAASFALARANETILSGSPPTSYADKYRLQPLALGDGVILVRYAMEKMRSVKVLKRMMTYLKRTFNLGWRKPVLWNTLLVGSTIMGDKTLAKVADNALFGQTALARNDPSQDGKGITKIEPSWTSTPTTSESLAEILTIDSNHTVEADESSLVILIHHLGKTSQFDRLNNLIYTLIPFLSESQNRNIPPSKFPIDYVHPSPDSLGFSGRTIPNHLTPNIYTALLASLALANRTGLSQRLYILALDAEKKWIEDHMDRHPSTDIPDRLRLPLGFYTAMLHVWGKEGRSVTSLDEAAKRNKGDEKGRERGNWAKGWVPPKSLAGQPRRVAAGIMAREVYLRAASNLLPPILPRTNSKKILHTPIPPSAEHLLFFDSALSSLSTYLGFKYATPMLSITQRNLFDRIIRDMTTHNIPIPPKVLERYHAKQGKTVGALTPVEYRVYGKEVVLEEKMKRSERLRGFTEELLRADEEGLWRDEGVRILDGECESERREGEIVII